MPEASHEAENEMARLIRGLANSAPVTRAGAAAEIFRIGRDIAWFASKDWFTDGEFADCFALDASRFPPATVGVAVQPATFERIRLACSSPPLADVPPDQDATEFELEFPDDVRLDILSTRQPGEAGAIDRHLQKFGESIQQVELLAKDIDRATRILRSRLGVVAVYPATRTGANGTRVNFFLVPAPAGKKVLIELVEARRDG